jgi:hypothetical protein
MLSYTKSTYMLSHSMSDLSLMSFVAAWVAVTPPCDTLVARDPHRYSTGQAK